MMDGDRQESQQGNHYPQNPQYPQTYYIPDKYLQHISLQKEWNEKMECLNKKYHLDYYSCSESDSGFEPEHKYETFI